MGIEGAGVDLRREMGRGGKRDGGVAGAGKGVGGGVVVVGEKIISVSVLRRVTAVARKKIPVIVPKVQVAG